MPTGIKLTDEQKRSIASEYSANKSTEGAKEIAKKYGISFGVVQRTYQKLKPHTNGSASAGTKTHKGSKYAHLEPKFRELHEAGFSYSEIGKKYNLTASNVGYWLNRGKKKASNHAQPKEHANGNGTFNKNIQLGIAYAETERFIGILAQRLDFTPELLRSRLSELLGHSPLREAPGSHN